jgi:hypothetical protein
MSDSTQSGPIMDGSDDATESEKLHGLIEQVEADRGDEGPGAMADELRDRLETTKAEPEEPGDLVD